MTKAKTNTNDRKSKTRDAIKDWKRKYTKNYTLTFSYRNEDIKTLTIWESISNKPEFIRYAISECGEQYLTEVEGIQDSTHYVEELKDAVGYDCTENDIDLLSEHSDTFDKQIEIAEKQLEMRQQYYEDHALKGWDPEPQFYSGTRWPIYNKIINLKRKGVLK